MSMRMVKPAASQIMGQNILLANAYLHRLEVEKITMPIKKQYEHKLIKKAIKHYCYNEPFNYKDDDDDFERSYQLYTKTKKTFMESIKYDLMYLALPRRTHIAAKRLLFNGD